MPRVVSPQAGRSLRRVLILVALAAAGPALAQSPTSTPPSAPAASAPGTAPAARRTVSPTGRTMPPARAVPPAAASAQPKAPNEAAMIKAQKAAEARSKAWDSKMHKTMGTICNGC